LASNPIAKGALGAAGTSALTGGKKKDILRSALLGGLGGYTFKEGAPGIYDHKLQRELIYQQ
jgi:hypothetical protein